MAGNLCDLPGHALVQLSNQQATTLALRLQPLLDARQDALQIRVHGRHSRNRRGVCARLHNTTSPLLLQLLVPDVGLPEVLQVPGQRVIPLREALVLALPPGGARGLQHDGRGRCGHRCAIAEVLVLTGLQVVGHCLRGGLQLLDGLALSDDLQPQGLDLLQHRRLVALLLIRQPRVVVADLHELHLQASGDEELAFHAFEHRAPHALEVCTCLFLGLLAEQGHQLFSQALLPGQGGLLEGTKSDG
mmetsp:Transcript_132644/g.330855  ORF Transcript_132644/g.330855 Transcript_132644/m.330855 type:complete len:246 (-) Transcript_132644:466-1203(-)